MHEPEESYNDPDKIQIPDFRFKNMDSVRTASRPPAGSTRRAVDENTYGKDTVMEQYPRGRTRTSTRRTRPRSS